MMGVNAAKTDALAMTGTGVPKELAAKNTIISMVAMDRTVKTHCMEFKAMLGSDSLLGSGGDMGRKVEISASVIHK